MSQQWSPDGNQWWDGMVWRQVSPDKGQYFDGQAWRPIPNAQFKSVPPTAPLGGGPKKPGKAGRNIGIIVAVVIFLAVCGSLANAGKHSPTAAIKSPSPTSKATSIPTAKATATSIPTAKATAAPTPNGSCAPQPCANDNYGWVVTVSNVQYGADSGNQFETPEVGNVYVTLNLAFTNKTGHSQSADPASFKLIDANGVSHDFTSIDICPLWSSVDIAPGGSYGPKCTAFEAVAGKPTGLVLDWNPSFFGGDYKIKLS